MVRAGRHLVVPRSGRRLEVIKGSGGLRRSELNWAERSEWMLLGGGILMMICGVGFFVVAMSNSSVRVSFLITGTIMLLSGLAMAYMGWGSDTRRKDEEQVLLTGIRGTATIMAIQPTGESVRKKSEVDLQLRSTLPGHPPYLITKTDLIEPGALASLAVGSAIPIVADPDDPLDITIDWEQLDNRLGRPEGF